jgi:hypothetical protein
MNVMRKIMLLAAIALILILPRCQKLVDGLKPPEDPNPTEAIPTDEGIPVGQLVSKTIGKAGGSLLSADGNAELIFPAGALDKDTEISVQALTNTAPNGVGNTYRCLPDGIKFLQPVTLKFHYTSDDLESTLGDLMGIAFQDSLGVWWRVNNFANDTVNKVISAPIRHFTSYTPFDILKIFSASNSVRVGKSLSLEIGTVLSDDDLLTTLAQGGDELAPLITMKNKTIVWSANGVVNGNATYGTVTGIGLGLDAVFKAPAKVPAGNHVLVSALVDVNFKYHGKTFSKTSLVSNITIIDREKYSLKIYLTEQALEVSYTDSAKMIVTISEGEVVAISDITNYGPNSLPAVVEYGGCSYTYVKEGIGEMNIVSGTGSTTAPYGDPIRVLNLEFTHSGAISPASNVVCQDSSKYTQGGNSLPAGIPSSLYFTITGNKEFEYDDGEVKATLTLL